MVIFTYGCVLKRQVADQIIDYVQESQQTNDIVPLVDPYSRYTNKLNWLCAILFLNKL